MVNRIDAGKFRMRISARGLTLLLFALTVLLPQDSMAGRVHDFYCVNCHPLNNMEPATGLADTLCLLCHSAGNNVPIQRLSNPTQSTDPPGGLFETGDASNLLGSYPAELTPGAQTSHIWSSGDIKPEAGALPPQKSAMNLSYFGVSKDKVVCSRCHDVHAFEESNPQLLRTGAGTADAMCLDCHRVWDVQNNHGKETHPMVPDYAAVLAANPDKFRALPDNFGSTGGINLLDGNRVSCTSCHGVHWVDSDASTLDGKANAENLSTGDGRLLRHDGPDREDPDRSLCQTCHNYARHGGGSPSIGCMVCHGSHEYDPLNNPNYYMLKKEVTLNRPLLDESQPAEQITVNFDYTMAPAAGNYDGYDGICLQCHVDNLSADHDASRENCSDCHSHESGFAHGGGGGCVECHGHDAGTLYDADMQEPYTAGTEACQGKGTVQSHSTHTEILGADAKGPGIYCDTCHDINNFPYFKSGTDSNADGKYSLAETDVCDTCHSAGGSYDGIDDPVVGAKQIWDTGAYDGTESGTLLAGKERWCVTCHDESPSVMQSVSAPNVAGDEDGEYTYGTGWGYYKTGHGLPADETFPSMGGIETLSGRPVECNNCHDYTTAHIDGVARTFDDGDVTTTDPSVYRQGYRLKLIGGEEPLLVPWTFGTPVDANRFRVCFQVGCHDSGPFLDSANMNTNLVTDGINRHEYHLRMSNARYPSDWSGANTSGFSCVTCHNVHGSTQLAMVRDGKLIGREPGLRMWYKNDGVTYIDSLNPPPEPAELPLSASDGNVWIPGSSTNLCAHCHGSGLVLPEDRVPFQDIADAPVLSWTGGTGLVADGVAPDSGVSQGFFTFRVDYSDANNDSPSTIQVWIDLDDSGSYEVDEKFAMAGTEAEDLNLFNGKTYTKSIALTRAGDGVLNYRFYASDGSLDATGAPTADSSVTVLNNAPTLAWTGEDFYQSDGVNPDIAGNGDSFTFRTDFTDIDNDVAATIQVWVDENDDGSYGATEKYDLTAVDAGDTTTSDGKRYATSLSLAWAGDGTLSYRFYATDGQDDATGTPTEDDALTVQSGANSPPILALVTDGCTVSGVKPQLGAADTDFVFTVNYIDYENEAPTTIEVWVDENDDGSYGAAEKYALTEVDGGDTTYSDGKLYSTSMVLALAGDNVLNYSFQASDGTDSALGEATSDHSVTVVDALKVRPAGGSGWYSTIQPAIDAIDGEHTILVYEGTYNEDIVTNWTQDANTTIRSVCGPDMTTLSGTGAGPVVTVGRYASTQILGFEVTGGTQGISASGQNETYITVDNCKIHDNDNLSSNGGGIYVSNAILLLTDSEIYSNTSNRGAGINIWRGQGHVIDNTIIRNNTATTAGSGFDGGGGVYLSQVFQAITISNSVVRDNVTDLSGGGIYLAQTPYAEGTGLTVTDSSISGNTATGSGGGINNSLSTVTAKRSSITGNTAATGGAISHPGAGVTTTFENCVLADNQADWAGAAKMNGGTLDIINSTIANNQATASNSGAIYNQSATVTIRNSILWGNQAAAGGHIAYFNGGTMDITDSIIQSGDDGNFTNAPFFGGNVTPVVSGFASEDDPWFVGGGDYHILSSSPAIDNASATYAPALDIDGESRPQGAADDIGADEYTP